MKFTLNMRDARGLAAFALTSKLFAQITTDAPELYNSGWISAIGGCAIWILSLSILKHMFGSDQLRKRPPAAASRIPFAVVEISFVALLLGEASGLSRVLAIAADYATMTSIRPVYLIIPLAAAVWLALCTNGDGICGAAQLWLRVFPLFFLIVLSQHAHSYNFRWLLPLAGPGLMGIIKGCFLSAGWLSPVAAFWLIAEPQEGDGMRPLTQTLSMTGIGAAILLVLHGSMLPSQIEGTASRLFQLDSLLSNGRASIASQLPMTVIFLAGLLAAITFELFLAAALLQRAVPASSGKIAACFITAASTALALSAGLERPEMRLIGYISFPFAVGSVLLLVITSHIAGQTRGGEKHVQKRRHGAWSGRAAPAERLRCGKSG